MSKKQRSHHIAADEHRLSELLLAGSDVVISDDNIERPLNGEVLLQAVTQRYIRLQPLGVARVLTTGNVEVQQ